MATKGNYSVSQGMSPMDFSFFENPAIANTAGNDFDFSFLDTNQVTDAPLTEGLSVMPEGGTDFMNTDFSKDLGIGGTPETPDVFGKWMKGGELGLGAAKVGLGIYSAREQAKMNKFMRGYYGNQMALQKADFSNAARSANEALSGRAARTASAKGQQGAAQNQAVAAHMNQWGVDESPV